MSKPPPIDEWYGAGEDSFARRRARGLLMTGVDQLRNGADFRAYRSLRLAEAAVEPSEARRVRGLVHLAAAGVKQHVAGDSRGARRQLDRARARLAEGSPGALDVDEVDELVRLVEGRVARASADTASGAKEIDN